MKYGLNVEVSMQNAKRLAEMARQLRLDGLDIALALGNEGAHLGGGFSCAEIMAVLYGEVLRFDVSDPLNANRDRFIASKAHCVLTHLPALAAAGFISREEMLQFQQDGNFLTGHPLRPEIGLEYSGGSLGMAISFGIGLALAAKEQGRATMVYILLGDGELHEGSNWEAFMSAPHFGVDNLVAVVDRNHLCYDGQTESVMPLEDLEAKLLAFNWHVTRCDGHSTKALLDAFAEHEERKPHVIIADTVKGKGVSFIENRPEWHQHRLSLADYEKARKEILEAEI